MKDTGFNFHGVGYFFRFGIGLHQERNGWGKYSKFVVEGVGYAKIQKIPAENFPAGICNNFNKLNE
jgi:hypothetical protein